MLVTTTVNLTTLPGVVVATLAVLRMVNPDTAVVAVQRVSTLPPAQFVPSVDDVTVLDNTLLPTSGLLTVTE